MIYLLNCHVLSSLVCMDAVQFSLALLKSQSGTSTGVFRAVANEQIDKIDLNAQSYN